MPKFSWKSLSLVAVGAGVPLAIFFVAREAASWRPQLIGVQSGVNSSTPCSNISLEVSNDESLLVSKAENDDGTWLWNLNRREHRSIPGVVAVIAPDSQLVATVFDNNNIRVCDQGHLLWTKPVKNADGCFLVNVRFSQNSKVVFCQSDDYIYQFDSRSGQTLTRTAVGYLPWNSADEGVAPDIIRSTIAFTPQGAKAPKYKFQTTNQSDDWDVSADGQTIWVSLAFKNRFDVLDAATGSKLWSCFSSKNIKEREFGCYPQFEDGGKSLATIENDALVVRDSQTGKVLLNHKNNLPAPLKSWAFTKDRSAVYLMDTKGEIFRQRLR